MKRCALTLILALAFLAPALTSTGAEPEQAPVFPPNVDPYGRTYGEWAADWWKWALEEPTSTNPLLDETGARCAIGQQGQVWFLAGLISSGKVTRRCTVPAGTALLFPVANSFACNDPGAQVGEEELRDIASQIRSAHKLHARIDGVAVRDIDCHYFEESEVFNVTLPADNIFGAPSGLYDPCVDAGYYLMVKPLPPGEHKIEFGAKLDDFKIRIKYLITVENG